MAGASEGRKRIPRSSIVILALCGVVLVAGIVAAITGVWETWWPWLSIAIFPLAVATAVVTFRNGWKATDPARQRGHSSSSETS